MSKAEESLSHERLKEVLRYCKDTGWFYRLTNTRGWRYPIGSVSGAVNPIHGYVMIRVDNKLHYGHRLAWFYVTGQWPIDEIDHANRNRADNRWANLREATRGQNQANRKVKRKGLKGVTPTPEGRWKARAGFDGEQVHIGHFETEKDAHMAYRVTAKKLHKEFARFK